MEMLTPFRRIGDLAEPYTGTCGDIRLAILVFMILATVVFLVWKRWWPPNSLNATVIKKGRHDPVFFRDAEPPDPQEKERIVAFTYGERKSRYEELIKALDFNIKLQGIFGLLALIVLLEGSETIEIPIARVPISVSWMYVIVPMVLLFLWLQFGFLLDSAADTRWALAQIISQCIDRNTVNYFHAAFNAFEDRGFLDVWCYVTGDDIYGSKTFRADRAFGSVLLGLYSVYFGIGHACMLSVAYAGVRRGWAEPWGFGLVVWVVLVVPIFAHATFYWSGVNRNWMQTIVAITAIIGTLILTADHYVLPNHKEIASSSTVLIESCSLPPIRSGHATPSVLRYKTCRTTTAYVNNAGTSGSSAV